MTTTRSCWACFEGEILWADLTGEMGKCVGVFVTSLEGILFMDEFMIFMPFMEIPVSVDSK